jgi:Ner family transcriptional regulator
MSMHTGSGGDIGERSLSEDDWAPERIREAIYAQGVSMEALAARYGYSGPCVRRALITRSPAGERLISELIGVPLHEIWPSRYFPDGRSRARPKRQHQTSPRRPRPHRQIGGAA